MLKINYKKIILVILLFCSLYMDVYTYMLGEVAGHVIDIIRLVTAITIGFYIFVSRKGKLSPIIFIIFCMQIPFLIGTIMNNGDIWRWFVETSSFLTLALWFELFCYDMGNLIEGLMFFLELLCYSNFITVQMFPDGMYSSFREAELWSSQLNWLLGNRNLFIVYLLPACMVAFLYRQKGGSRWREYGLYIISWMSVALPPVSSATSTVGVTLFLVFIFLIKCGVKLDTYFLVGINIVAFLAIVVFRLQDVLFSWLIEGVFEKTLTFTGRTPLWDAVLEAVKKKPLFGYGCQDSIYSVRLLGFNYAGHAHNLILHYLYQGGILYLASYIFMMTIIYKRLHKYQRSRSVSAVSAVLFVFQIMALMEPYKVPFILILYLFAYHSASVYETDMFTRECLTIVSEKTKTRLS